MTGVRDEAWGDAVAPLLEPRTRRPRTTGITAVIDKGLGSGPSTISSRWPAP